MHDDLGAHQLQAGDSRKRYRNPSPAADPDIVDDETAPQSNRALLRMEAAEPVTEADMVDAYGEPANVFGGNIKALLPEHVGITLPGVSHESATGAGARLLHEVVLTWRGRPFKISLWTI